MLKLFRNIRKNLLAEGKTAKYFKYAIGEIILVVIGILIALSINNWSEQTKKEELGIDYLQQLKQDLTLDAQIYKEQIKNLSSQLKRVDSLLIIIDNPDTDVNTVKNVIKINSTIFNIYDNYDINNNTFLALQNSGNMNLIKKSVYDEVLDLNRAQKHYIRVIRDNSFFLLDVSLDGNKDLPLGGGTQLKEQLWQTVDWNSASIKFVNTLFAIKVVNESHIKVTRDILNKTNALNELISNEIENN